MSQVQWHRGLEIAIASSAAHFVQENDIFGHRFLLEFEWIEKVGFWLLHMSSAKDNPIVSGLKLEPSIPLFTYHQTKNAPIAFMLLCTKSGQSLNRQSLKQDFVLVAYEAL